MSINHFCTCTDYTCQYNPQNHSDGCDRCIKISLEDGEIPRCFFNAISEKDAVDVTDFTYRNFASFVLSHSK